ncbi:U1 small nuclear ribonucleoprotein, putative [Trypanosoma brucei gambiense DAL972]|uniref:U1 small nuclear ribonucleoprotein, putative n=2 Tax=Trypanosoma brucei TaxID=5691 RepID=C9ZVT4_TRYB9|nr:U1 small nuclear ribonucleoprotein, putative [Trypanosoma brucei gambiense DAL972]RHW70802.1 U1 small nuclear ribonucleoprotein [Trypanosoma brucei equiperdum]CBH13522.1 U1 small nuclear ribonucleoprotein, putative [Trypanosoma brucei gambiense DAL972]|eukprot:XP_011775799.1 U1 small nuclear ribonucleoprotein, putative [Trypanosoma brucei gambiense DAL972]
MQTPGEEDLVHKKNAQRRVEEHMRWKAAFFQSRPPPPFVPQCRRRREPIASSPVHIFHKRALELVAAERPPVVSSSSMNAWPVAAAEKSDPKRSAWLEQMKSEMNRRNPYTDLNICSDPRCTVVMSGLHAKTVEEDIRIFSEQFGRVVSTRLIFDRNGHSRRYGFVQFGREADVQRAVASSGKRRLHGRSVVIDVERGRQEPEFLPKRIAKAVKLQGTSINSPVLPSGDTPIGKRQRNETERQQDRSREAPTKPEPSGGELRHRDDVDILLDDIMSIT